MDHYDVIIIGTGAGGGTLLHELAGTGKRILVLERGPFLPREKENWDTKVAFNTTRYFGPEVWQDRDGNDLRAGMCYHVGGNTKLYGAALFRLRERDFEAVRHVDGISPEWPLKYWDWEPWYARAEELYDVHGQAGLDPTEPSRSGPYPWPAVSHEPRIAEITEALRSQGLQPSYTPLGVRLNEQQRHLSPCIRCSTCDGYPCLVHAKSDAEVSAVRPVLGEPNVTLLVETKAERLLTDSNGREVTGVEVLLDGEPVVLTADVFVVSCGAINSAALLLRSANDQHPQGLANSSGLLGRNLMKHVLGSVIGVSSFKTNPTKFQKSLSVFDYYWGEPGFEFPMGQIQTLGKVSKAELEGSEAMYAPLDIEFVSKHSVDWWLTSEDLPRFENQVRLSKDGRIVIDYTETNAVEFERLMTRWKEVLKSIGCGCHMLPNGKYFNAGSVKTFTNKLGTSGLGHQVGTAKFGEDPATSVLDLNCRTHDLDNLYVVDGSFLVSSAAVNPTLTIIANALRVGAHLRQRLGARASSPARIPSRGSISNRQPVLA
ncbi:MAG TPA: GMC family oxidoreductase [Verrucomicrobiota bacterium]|nr:dehydrogenase [Verrucomicrobiales bacterium]HRI13053.1 GMC family oxidoreductase [Verrucomicrobiota bacterium]